jgi:hypothetical protein
VGDARGLHPSADPRGPRASPPVPFKPTRPPTLTSGELPTVGSGKIPGVDPARRDGTWRVASRMERRARRARRGRDERHQVGDLLRCVMLVRRAASSRERRTAPRPPHTGAAPERAEARSPRTLQSPAGSCWADLLLRRRA